MKIIQIRNATVKFIYKDRTFLVDPWLEDRGKGFSAHAVTDEMQGVRCPMNDLPASVEEILSGVDFCLVTHVHPDHITKDYIPDDMHMIAQNSEDAEKLRKMGFTDVSCFESDTMKTGSLEIIRVEGIHGDNPEVVRKMGTVSGYVVRCENEKTVYIAGDTIFYDGVVRNIQTFSPDVILINCAGAATPTGRLIMHLEDTEAVCRTAPQAMVIATHLDSVNHALVSRKDVQRLKQEKKLDNLLIPDDGETITVQ